MTKSSKYLFFDLGVRRVAAREGTQLRPETMGELFEQWVGLELIRLMRSGPMRLRFWRDPGGPEVDWIIDRGREFTPVEVKWSRAPSARDARHLEVFLDEYSAKAGYVVCRSERRVKLTRRVTAIPWTELHELVQ